MTEKNAFVGMRRRATYGFFVSSALLAMLMAGSLYAQEHVSGTDKQGRTIIGDTPWVPPVQKTEPKVIYGTDDRIDVYQETDLQRLIWAASTCGLADSSDLTDNGNGTYTIATSAYTYASRPACPGEPFADQPTAVYCTGFLVGEDIIATAGHCVSSSDVGTTRFIFGFKMLDATTPVITFNEDQVYSGVELIGRAYDPSNYDYSIVRVDRPVVAPGAEPLPIRRSGVIPIGTALGVIGHPSGLPTKLAFGPTTKVYENSEDGYFVANLDTYGGNSGSPVFNVSTGLVEGILVRGHSDFVLQTTCFVSDVENDSSAAEEVSKSLTFMSYIPDITGIPRLEYAYFACGQLMNISVSDPAATAGGTIHVSVESDSGDVEDVVLTDATSMHDFEGSVYFGAESDPVTIGNGIVEGMSGDTITVSYNASSGLRTNTATLDCHAPVISDVVVQSAGVESARISFLSDEDVTPTIEVGTDCVSFPVTRTGTLGTSHTILLSGLTADTAYLFHIVAVDRAGNTSTAVNPVGNCFYLHTGTYGSPLIQADFDSGLPSGWTKTSVGSTDTWTLASSSYAHSTPFVDQFVPSSSTARDARLISPTFSGTNTELDFYHTYDFEDGYDGGVVEVSVDGGISWVDLGDHIMTGGYNSGIDSDTGSPIPGRRAWSGGAYGAMTQVRVDLSAFPGDKKVAFRFTADNSSQSSGWLVDSVQILPIIPSSSVLSAGGNWVYY